MFFARRIYYVSINYNIIINDCVRHRHLRASRKAVATRCLAGGYETSGRPCAAAAATASAGNRQLTVPTAITAGRLRLATAVAAPPGHRPPTTASSAGCAPPPDDRRHRRQQCRRHHRDPEVFFYDLAGPRHQRRRIARAAWTHSPIRPPASPSNV